MNRVLDILLTFLQLGCVAFGGPVAHIGYYREWFVRRRAWVDDAAFARLLALSQFLPGPSSTQLAFALGHARAGLPGGLAAWIGFSLPSTALMIAFAAGLSAMEGPIGHGWLMGLKVAALAVIVHAILGMARQLCPAWPQRVIAMIAALSALTFPHPAGQLATLAGGGALALLLVARPETAPPAATTEFRVAPAARRRGLVLLALFAAGFVLATFATLGESGSLHATLYRVGSLVFGGGHVVLPLLEAEIVRTGLMDAERFLAGYGAAQAVPGPVFTFSAYIGASLDPETPISGGLLAAAALFLPGILLMAAAVPFWDRLARVRLVAHALLGINAAVVGLLIAVVIHPVAPYTLRGPEHVALALAALLALYSARVPAYAVVLCSAVAGWLLLGP